MDCLSAKRWRETARRGARAIGDRWIACCLSVFVAAVLTGCASGPVARGSDSHGLAIEEFFMKDPHDLRVALRSDHRTKRGAADPSIVLRATVDSRPPACYALALAPVDPSMPQEMILETAPVNRRWYVFGVSKEGIATLEQARREVQPSRTEGGNLNFEFALNDVIAYADDPQGSPLRVDVAVDRKAGYFTISPERTIRPPASTKSPAKSASPCGGPA